MENKDIINAMGINAIQPKTEQEKKENKQNIKLKEHSSYIKVTKIFSNIFFILCIIGGIVLGNISPIKTTLSYYPYIREEFNVTLMLSSWVVAFVSWVVMYGIACIVENTEK